VGGGGATGLEQKSSGRQQRGSWGGGKQPANRQERRGQNKKKANVRTENQKTVRLSKLRILQASQRVRKTCLDDREVALKQHFGLSQGMSDQTGEGKKHL